MEDPKYQYYGVPVLSFEGGPDVCPFDLVTFTVHRQDKALLYEVYSNQHQQFAEAQKFINTKKSKSRVLVSQVFQPISEDDFNSWLTFITDQLDLFFERLEPDVNLYFDFSPNSLKAAGKLLLGWFSSPDSIQAESELFCDLYTYIGEVFHRNLGAQFYLPASEDDEKFGQPSIRCINDETFSLPQLAFDALVSQKADFVFQVYNRMVNSEGRV
ncbi:hypothetical protein [Aliikangiella maris]|uniref:DUF3037 domain-containing protein n=2 Tax=Aliikangiella maris TaxID=3162458 RepID=A0ABV3MVM4_9GAMM